MRTRVMAVAVSTVVAVSAGGWLAAQTSEQAYELVAGWARLPAGKVFGHPQEFPPPAERDRARAEAEKQRAEAIARGQTPAPRAPSLQPGVSGVAVDRQDRVYVFHRGQPPVFVFDRQGTLVGSGAAGLTGDVPHFIEVDRDGHVWVVDEAAHRVLKLDKSLDKVLLQIGVTNEAGHDATHLDRPADVAFTSSGHVLIADGYGNNRMAMFAPDGRFIKQWGGGPDARSTEDGGFHLPHAVEVDAQDTIYVIDRENRRIQKFDKDGRFLGKWTHLGYAWGMALSRDGRFLFVAEHDREEILKVATADGRIVARWGRQGRGPGEFDWAHAVAVDSAGAVYIGDTYGQRLQKFVAKGGT